MIQKYEHEIIDSAGGKHPFSLSVGNNGATGELVWPPETSRLELIRRVTENRITALIVWSTMKIRCWIAGSPNTGGTDLEIVFATTPYRYRVEDGGELSSSSSPHSACLTPR